MCRKSWSKPKVHTVPKSPRVTTTKEMDRTPRSRRLNLTHTHTHAHTHAHTQAQTPAHTQGMLSQDMDEGVNKRQNAHIVAQGGLISLLKPFEKEQLRKYIDNTSYSVMWVTEIGEGADLLRSGEPSEFRQIVGDAHLPTQPRKWPVLGTGAARALRLHFEKHPKLDL